MYEGPPDNPFLNFRTDHVPPQSSPFYSDLPLRMFDISAASNSENLSPGNAFDKTSRTEARISPVLPSSSQYRRPGYFEQLAGIGLGIGNLLAENVFSHPCVVLRRQCQINGKAISYHTMPFTLLPVVFNLQHNQGVLCLWKGVFGGVGLTCMYMVLDKLLSDFFGLPREVTRYSSCSKKISHLLLKMITFSITTPFAVAAFVQTVQSDVVSEKPGPLDFVRNGLKRISLDFTGTRDTRRFPMWCLFLPSTLYRLVHYVLSNALRYVVHSAVKSKMLVKMKKSKTLIEEFFPDLFAAFTSYLLADAVLFPAETVLHRLYIQGTRTIIDNLDNGSSVIPVSSRYDGLLDCIRSIASEEGAFGFYRGFGALILQYLLHFTVLHLLRVMLEQLEDNFASDNPPLFKQQPPSEPLFPSSLS